MDDRRKNHIDTKGLKQRNHPKQLQTHNLPTNDVENINSTNKGRDLQLANKPQFVSWWTARMLQSIQRHRRVTLRRSTHPIWEQDQTDKSSYGLNWLQKGIWYRSALPPNVQNMTWSRKLYRQNQENLENGIDRNFAETKIQRGICQGYALSPLLFIITIMPLNQILRRFVLVV